MLVAVLPWVFIVLQDELGAEIQLIGFITVLSFLKKIFTITIPNGISVPLVSLVRVLTLISTHKSIIVALIAFFIILRVALHPFHGNTLTSICI